jgi:hypothetical protein
MSGTTGSLQPGVSARGAQARGDVHRPDHALGERSLTSLAVAADGQERLHHGDPLGPAELADRPAGELEGGHGAGVVEVDPDQHLAAVQPTLDHPATS